MFRAIVVDTGIIGWNVREPGRMQNRETILAAMAAIEAQRAALGDDVVDETVSALRARLGTTRPGDVRADVATALRQVSVLFVDVVESTRLASRLGPEDVRSLMDGALVEFRDVVESNGGRALQYAGDSLLAAFGTETTREDDAERAVRAGLAILDQSRRYASKTQALMPGMKFAVRVGIHTGTVLLSAGVDSTRMIRGSTVNVAARMEQSAPPGGLRISHATYRCVRGVFDVSEEAPVRLKDHDEPVRSYVVQRPKPRAFRSEARGLEGVETKMIGRDVELSRLQAAFHDVAESSVAVAFTIAGDAGLGKTRLLQEFRDWADLRKESFLLFQGRAFEESPNEPYGVLRSLLTWRFQIPDDAGLAEAKLILEREIVPLFGGDEPVEQALAHAHLLGQLVGFDFADSPYVAGIVGDGRQIRNRGFNAAAEVIRRMARRGSLPVVMLLEDLHWADSGSLDFVSYLLQVAEDVPLLVLATARPALFERRPDWPSVARHQRLELAPLDAGVTRLLAGEMLKGFHEVPEALRQLVCKSAGGNPYYMEEVLKMLADEGAIDMVSRPWQFQPQRLHVLKLPNTLVGVLQARLDRLGAPEKLALQQSSTMGVVFWEKGLAAIDAASPEHLPSLMQKALVHAQPSSRSDQGREYGFSHHLLHRVTYETLLRPARQQYHARVAAWLEGMEPELAKELASTIAEHHERAGDLAKACRYWVAAAEDAEARFATEGALIHGQRALSMLGDESEVGDADLRWRLRVVLEKVGGRIGSSDHLQALDALQRSADATQQPARQGYASYRRSDYWMRHGNYPLAEPLAREAMAWADAAHDLSLRIRAATRLAAILHYRGQSEAAASLLNESLRQARSAGLGPVQCLCLNVISVVSLLNDPLAALSAEQEGLALCRGLGDLSGAATAMANTGASWLLLGDLEAAEKQLREALDLCRSIGERDSQPYALLNLSTIAWRQGRDVDALTLATEALTVSTAAGSQLKVSGALFWLGNAQKALGDRAAARASFERALSIGNDIGHAQRFDAAGGLARLALLDGDVALAVSLVEPALHHLENGGRFDGCDVPMLIRLTCSQALAAAGDERSDGVLADAFRILQERAARIQDAPLRGHFLALREHAQIEAAWETRRQ